MIKSSTLPNQANGRLFKQQTSVEEPQSNKADPREPQNARFSNFDGLTPIKPQVGMFGDQGAPTTPGLTQSSKLTNRVQQKEKESPNGKRDSRDMHKKVSEMKKSLTGSLAQ